MHKYRKIFTLACCFFICSTAHAQAGSVIAEVEPYLDKFCSALEISGSSVDGSVSGTAKADINKIIKSLVDVGISGEAELKLQQYSNVKQEDLPDALKNRQTCTLELLRMIIDLRKAEIEAGKGADEKPVLDVSISIDKYKTASGRGWDYPMIQPDANLCLKVNDAADTYCSATDKFNNTKCKNRYECTVRLKADLAESYKVILYDMDSSDDDVIGFGDCAVNTRCRLTPVGSGYNSGTIFIKKTEGMAAG